MRSSQHDLMWRQLLPKVRKHDEPLQVQLCTAFVTAMLDGRLPGGTRLPSSRDLAMLTGFRAIPQYWSTNVWWPRVMSIHGPVTASL